jgi:hypothetical protein
MTKTVALWIDHARAVIVSVSGPHATTTTVDSGIGGHPHFGGQQDGGGEKRYEERHAHDLNRFYDEVVGHLKAPAALLIFGPGEAKLELKARLDRATPPLTCPVEIDTAGAMTDPQIVARAKEYAARMARML